MMDQILFFKIKVFDHHFGEDIESLPFFFYCFLEALLIEGLPLC